MNVENMVAIGVIALMATGLFVAVNTSVKSNQRLIEKTEGHTDKELVRARYRWFDDHQYVYVSNGNGGEGIAHSPKCPCHTNRLEAADDGER